MFIKFSDVKEKKTIPNLNHVLFLLIVSNAYSYGSFCNAGCFFTINLFIPDVYVPVSVFQILAT